MREKGGDGYYYVCVKGLVLVVLCFVSNIVLIFECMVCVCIYFVILYDLYIYIFIYLYIYVLLYIYGNFFFGFCLLDYLVFFSDFLLIYILSLFGNVMIVDCLVFEWI